MVKMGWGLLVFLVISNSWGGILEPVPRKVLGLYKLYTEEATEEEEPDVADTHLHLHAEVVLNHLGLDLVLHDIDEPLPKSEALKGYRGILTWFESLDAVSNPNAYCVWVKEQMERGLKLVILDSPGVFADKGRAMPQACEEMFERLGAKYSANFSDNPFYFEITHKDSAMVEFERKIVLTEGHQYTHYEVTDPKAKVYLTMGRRDLEKSESDLIWTTPHGGFAHPTFVFYRIKEIEKRHWRIDPFRFFEEAFALEGLPRPDTSTINGRRIFYTHIDGDGIVNVSHIDNKSYAGEIILKEILKKYSTLPITASIITGYLEMREFQEEKVMKLYEGIFGLPNVEPAAHGHSHPFIWKKKELALKVPKFRYTDEGEIVGSVQKVNALLEKLNIPKRANLFLWTGDCRPTEEQLTIPYQAKFLNMNGGDSRMDERYDSYSFLYPLSVVRGKYRQIYSSAPNENVFTHLWKGPYFGFRDIIQTFKNTESPLRIKPINIYYHYYSGEVAAALKALQTAYDYALTQPIVPIFASEYVPIVHDFFNTRILTLPGGGFQILNNGDLKTIRFDNETNNVDLNRSQGVIGFNHFQGNLYVFLDAKKSHEIYRTAARPQRPYVMEASVQIRNFSASSGRLKFEKKGWPANAIVFGGMQADKDYWVHVGGRHTLVKSNPQGQLSVGFEKGEGAGDFVTVRIAPHYLWGLVNIY